MPKTVTDLASEYPYSRPFVSQIVELCDGDTKAAEWMLQLFIEAGGPVMLPSAGFRMLAMAAKKATERDEHDTATI